MCVVAVGVGCSGNPTNEPSAAAVQKANEDRAKAIDNDPTFTPQQKEQMKAAMGLGGKKSR